MPNQIALDNNSHTTQGGAAMLDDNFYKVVKLAIELGLVPPHQCDSLASTSWLETTLTWITDAQTVLYFANNVACAMNNASSATQIYLQNFKSLAWLQLRQQQALEAQPHLQQEIENLSSRQSKLIASASELEEWASTAYERLYKKFFECLQQRQRFTDDLISLPQQLSVIAHELSFADAPWDLYRKSGLVKVGRLLVKHREWYEVYSMTESFVRTRNAKPSAIEPILRQIADETVKSILISAGTWIKQLQAETEQEIQKLQKKLNEQQRNATHLQMQITDTQKRLENLRCDADIKFHKAILLLEELIHLPQIPKNLQALIEQYRQAPANIVSQNAKFSATINYWNNRTEELRKLVFSLQELRN